ncbi:MAG: diguanylate cyclase [Planctomycetes bacterium]|nr:diguanylate cyclase [Planctomycetota bacterium]
MRAMFLQSRKLMSGLQFRTTLLLTFVVLAAAGLTAATCLRVASRITISQTKRHARDIARSLASTTRKHVQGHDRSELLAVAEECTRDSELVYVIFADAGGEMIAGFQKNAGHINQYLLDDVKKVSVEPIDEPQLSYRDGDDARIDVVYPVYGEHVLVQQSEVRQTLGYVRIGVSLARCEARLDALLRDTVGLAIGITLLMIPVGYEVVRNLVSPLNKLRDAARSIAQGALQARVHVKRNDEIGELAAAFNGMADTLEESHGSLLRLNTELEARVEKRTEALEQATSKFKELAAKDSLTGLYNRRHFNELIGQLYAESTRYHSDLTCMMIDLDNFKRVNDSLGHQIGDELLKLTASVLLECVREADVAVRYGGDEFIVLMPQTAQEDARRSAERIISRFRSELAKQLPEASIASLSIGLASRANELPTDPMQLVQLADEALYLAKAGGKNRITVLRPVPTHADNSSV